MLAKVKEMIESSIIVDPGRCPECGRDADGRGHGVLRCSHCGISWDPSFEGYEYVDICRIKKALTLIENILEVNYGLQNH